jgi:hypothetical protein
MTSPATILGHRPALSYGQIARRYGMTRGQVAGIVFRARRPAPPPQPPKPAAPRDSRFDGAILDLLSDGRIRTTHEIAAALGGLHSSVFKRLAALEATGTVRLVQRGRGCAPSIWAEDEGDWS